MRKTHQEDVRNKIQASLLINRLHDCSMGTVDLTSVQVQAIKILLDKAVSNAPTDLHVSEVNVVPVEPDVL